MQILKEHIELLETTQNVALQNIANYLNKVLPSNSIHPLDISINGDLGAVIIKFKDSNVSYVVYPGVSGSITKASTHTVPLTKIPGYTIQNGIVYDLNNVKLGTALVRLPKNYTVDDYSDKLEDAKIFNSGQVISKNRLLKKYR